MNIPDPAVYAALPLLGGAAVWIARQFVTQTAGPRGDVGPRGLTGQDAPPMTIRDYRQVAAVMKDELNGRYMLATEARERFAALEEKVDEAKREFIERLERFEERMRLHK